MNLSNNRFLHFCSALLLSVSASVTWADDSEIFFNINTELKNRPNILFILDNSRSMDNIAQYTIPGDEPETRLAVMQRVVTSLADSVTDVNIGLMAFNTDDYDNNDETRPHEGGRVFNRVQDISENAAAFKTAVDGLSSETSTPLAEALFGAMRYFKGGEPFLDQNPKEGTVSDGKYISPIEYECQSNNIVLLTDGKPEDDGHKSEMQTEIDIECNDNCLDAIAEYMNTNDMMPSAEFPGKQTVRTYTIGFGTNQTLLADTARKGGGTYYTANNADELVSTFEDVVRSVLDTNGTSVALGVAVNSFNRLSHLNSLYYSMFVPDTRPLWEGNLKRYKMSDNGEIVDADGAPAIDPTTGFFNDGARSWWSAAADGSTVNAGGVREQLPNVTSNRNVYSWLSGKDLTAADNQIAVTNTDLLTKTLLGDAAMSSDKREDTIRWVRGEDRLDANGDGSTSDARKFMADPLHSEPKLVVYGGSEQDPDTAVFYGDNQGFVHAVNGATGDAYFSFMPPEFLKNQRIFMDNSKSVAQRIYGMDGSVVSWVKNPSGDVSTAEGDHVYLYTGMRRGGRSYYALDATDRNAPKAMWKVAGGSGDFVELGQSWSTPVKSRVNLGGVAKDVLFIGGGYDPHQDSVNTRSEDSMGRALYIVDAQTGARLWWAGPKDSGADLELDDMKYSMPASPKVLDIDGDGLADQVYIGDMGGQIWRFDFNSDVSVNRPPTGGRIADFAGNAESSARRFYHTPDLSVGKYWGKRYLALIIGSGYQAHPLNKEIEDRAYMLRIPSMLSAPLDSDGNVAYTPVNEADLYDITDNKIGQGTAAEKLAAEQSLSSANGWMLKLTHTGEKILGSSIVVGGVATFTTYQPSSPLSACEPSTGKSRLYTTSLRDGTPVRNYDEIGDDIDLTTGDRSKEIMIPGIPPSPKLLRTETGSFICIGTKCEPVGNTNTFTQTFWREAE